MEKDKFLLERVEELQTIVENTISAISGLESGIKILATNLKEIENIKELTESIERLDDNVILIDRLHNNLNSIVTNTNSFSDITLEAKEIHDKFIQVDKNLKELNTDSENIINLSGNISLDSVIEKLNIVESRINKVTRSIDVTLNEKIDNKLTIVIEELDDKIERTNIKIDKFKEQNQKTNNELLDKEKDLEEYIKKSIETNDKLIKLFTEQKNKNIKMEDFVNDLMNDWYKKNIGFFGIKKKKGK